MTSQLPVSPRSSLSGSLPRAARPVSGSLVIVLDRGPARRAMAALTRGGRRGGVELGFTSTTVLLAAIPDFLFAVGLVYLFAVRLHWLPIAGRSGWRSYVLPVCSLSLGSAAVLTRIVRVEVLSVLGEDYIRTARAKRLRARIST